MLDPIWTQDFLIDEGGAPASIPIEPWRSLHALTAEGLTEIWSSYTPMHLCRHSRVSVSVIAEARECLGKDLCPLSVSICNSFDKVCLCPLEIKHEAITELHSTLKTFRKIKIKNKIFSLRYGAVFIATTYFLLL